MQTPSQEADRNGSQEAAPPTADAPTEPDTLMECLHKACRRLFQQEFLIFLNCLAGQDLIYAGIGKARQLVQPAGSQSLDEHWNALAAARMRLSDSKESKRFLKPATPPPPTPYELSEYFKEPFANPWQANELAICQGILKDVGQYRYMSFAFTSPSSEQVAHIVFGRNEQAPQIGQIGPCFQTH